MYTESTCVDPWVYGFLGTLLIKVLMFSFCPSQAAAEDMRAQALEQAERDARTIQVCPSTPSTYLQLSKLVIALVFESAHVCAD
jgi:hypothetical protein